MNRQIIKTAAFIIVTATAFTACKKDDNGPQPEEQELITTVKLTLTEGSNAKTYIYKVENGFDVPVLTQADTLQLEAGKVYSSSIEVLNEKANPVQNITQEIIDEKDEHLFFISSNPTTGAGSAAFSNGALDADAKPFNITGTLTAGASGSGALRIYLIHQPADKNGTTLATVGGSTDASTEFPVIIR